MLRRIGKISIGLVMLVAAYLALLGSEWLPLQTDDARAARAMLVPPEPPTGRSAYAVFWFVRDDMTGRDRDALLAEDVRRLAAADASGAPGFVSLADAWPKAPEVTRDALCPATPAFCLEHVRALPTQGGDMLATWRTQLANLDELHATDHFAYPFAASDRMPLAGFAGLFQLPRVAALHAHLRGDTTRALRGACRDLATWRRLRPTSDLLIQDMIALAMLNAHVATVRELLALAPPDFPLPDECEAALAPLAVSELDQCGAWRGEFAWLQRQPADLPGWRAPTWISRLLLNRRATEDRFAIHYAGFCAGAPEFTGSAEDWISRVFDPAGAVYADTIAAGNYHERHLDALDLLRTLRIQAWLRDKADPDAAWAAIPESFQPVPAGLSWDPAARTLHLALRQPGAESPHAWLFPLPAQLPASPPPG